MQDLKNEISLNNKKLSSWYCEEFIWCKKWLNEFEENQLEISIIKKYDTTNKKISIRLYPKFLNDLSFVQCIYDAITNKKTFNALDLPGAQEYVDRFLKQHNKKLNSLTSFIK